MTQYSIDFNLNDTPVAIEAALRRAPILAERMTDWVLDLRQCRYLGPDAASLIASALLSARKRGAAPTTHLPEKPEALRGFLSFSGLAGLVNGTAPPDPDHPRNETLPLQQFERASWGLAEPLVRLVRRHGTLSAEWEDALRLAVGEVTQNIDDHAESLIGGVLSARFFRASNEVRVAVVDHGKSIPSTLRRTHPDLADASRALSAVLKGGYTSKSRLRNKGLGVSNLADVVKTCGGDMTLLSGAGIATIRAGTRPVVRPLDTAFQGTAAFFTLRPTSGP